MLFEIPWFEFWRFRAPHPLALLVQGQHQVALVALSVSVAILAAFAAWSVVDRMVVSRTRRARWAWLWTGATVLGTGIWAMHFIGILAFVLPIDVSYHIGITLASALPAVLGSVVVLSIMSRDTLTPWKLQAGSVALALAIGTMHYLGMEALTLHADMHYHPGIFVLSILVAYLLAMLALQVRFAARRLGLSVYSRPIGSAVIGLAIAGMHYIAMASVRFHVSNEAVTGHGVSPTLMALLICLLVLFTLGVTLLGTRIDRKMLTAAESLAAAGIRHTTVLRTMTNGVVTFDDAGRIESVNTAMEELFGYSESELTALTVDDVVPGCFIRAESSSDPAGQPDIRSTFESVGRTRSGQQVPVELVISPMIINGKEVFSAIVRNITERKEAETALRLQFAEVEQARQLAAAQAEELRFQAEELEVARDRAEAGSRAKADFLAAMSHEIRTPMNGVLGMAHILLDTDLTAEQREYVQTIHTSGQALLTIINDILDFSKIEAGKLDIEPIPFDMHTVAADVVDLLLPAAEAKALELAVRIDRTMPRRVIGDPGRIRQIILNLVSNAIKFTDRGHVLIEMTGEECAPEARLRIAISDTGIGITADARQRLFATFSQADATTTRKYGGTGLGLAISKRLIELMGGEIGVDSTPDVGSTFWFDLRLPLAAPASVPVAGTTLAGARVLIVDDSPINRTVLVRQVEGWEMHATTASGGEEALRLLGAAAATSKPFDLAILDLNMPGMDGMELAGKIKSDPALGTVRLLLLTSSARRGDGPGAKAAGFDGFLVKPAPPDAMQHVLRSLYAQASDRSHRALVTRHVAARPMAGADTVTPPSPQRAETRPTRRVLLAEDNPVNQRVAALMLERLGCRVDVASNGLEAVDLAGRLPYDIIFLDCQMPELDGYGAARAIREREAGGQRTPIIALTANAMGGDREACLAAGMDDYLSKPIGAAGLADAIKQYAGVTARA